MQGCMGHVFGICILRIIAARDRQNIMGVIRCQGENRHCIDRPAGRHDARRGKRAQRWFQTDDVVQCGRYTALIRRYLFQAQTSRCRDL